MKKAIILAAGQGRRLWPYTQNRPKCLLQVGQKSIIAHQIDRLWRAGINDITVVSGYKADMIYSQLNGHLRYIHNHDYAVTSSLFSFWLARKQAEEGFLLLNSDVLFHEEILYRLLDSPHPDALAMEYNMNLGEEEMKVQVRRGKVYRISKSLEEFDGENLGVVKFSKKGAEKLLMTVAAAVESGMVDVPIPYAFNQLAKHHGLHVVATAQLPWIEIDFPEDLQWANRVVYPQIMQQEKSMQAA